MHVAAILKDKGRAVETARADTPLSEIVRVLSTKRIGAIVLVDAADTIVGIVSERDVIHAMAKEGAAALQWPADEIMSRNVVTCTEGDTLDQLMNQMTVRRFRHMPVISDGRLAGIISIGDVVKHHVAEVEMEASAMRVYITSS